MANNKNIRLRFEIFRGCLVILQQENEDHFTGSGST